MYIHLYNRGRDIADREVDIEQALALLENQQDIGEEPENFIGFTAPEHQDAVLQFIRHDQVRWMIDIPKVENERYVGSYQTMVDHSIVLTLTAQFFLSDSKLRASIVNQDYNRMQDECLQRWSIIFNFIQA